MKQVNVVIKTVLSVILGNVCTESYNGRTFPTEQCMWCEIWLCVVSAELLSVMRVALRAYILYRGC